MKKVFLFILTILYMTVSSGIALEIHYCMGERTGADLFVSSGKKCGRCGMEEKKGGCCSDEHQFYKLSDEHKLVNNGHVSFSSESDMPFQIFFENKISSPLVITSITSLPPFTGPPLYISNCVFRI